MFKKYLKRFFYFMLFITFVVTGAYISGTFHPNDYVVGQIEDEVHRKEMKVVEALDVVFAAKASFPTAVFADPVVFDCSAI